MPKLSGSSTLNPNGLISPTDQWKLQWNMVKRWKKRLEKLKSENLDDKDFDEVRDFVITFLQNCYHLRDWITASQPKLTKKVNDLFKNSFELKCCRDVCNGLILRV